ncbi:MAG TPA: GntR family transcriptional regulator [Gaiellaceae bacterium]|nr:GntR family transcriptional regulator [Gaiellaceae bacterium]
MAALFEGQASLARTASVAAADLIRQAIVEGRVLPGQRLKEEELAQQLGISRTPIREALLVLQTEGLLEASPNRGATVRSYDVRDLEEMYELRALLEGHAARRAASRVGAEQLDVLRASCERFAALVGGADVPALVAENAVFHETILAAAGSERLSGMVRQVVALPLTYKSYVWYSPEQASASYHYHQQLVKALERGDGERAELVMCEHVFEARDVLVQHMTAAGSPVQEVAAAE